MADTPYFPGVFLQANYFGYWVSDDPAITVGSTAPQLKQKFSVASNSGRTAGLLLLSGVLMGTVGLCTFSYSEQSEVARLFAGCSIFIAVSLIVIGALWHSVDSKAKRVTKLANGFPWQAWPCRIESKTEFHLMDPDQNIVTTFENIGKMPNEVWQELTDSIGVLWLCGDLRQDVLVTLPGGEGMWRAKPKDDRPGPNPLSKTQEAAASAAIHVATTATLHTWLDEDQS